MTTVNTIRETLLNSAKHYTIWSTYKNLIYVMQGQTLTWKFDINY